MGDWDPLIWQMAEWALDLMWWNVALDIIWAWAWLFWGFGG
jgi:hypothetical protein